MLSPLPQPMSIPHFHCELYFAISYPHSHKHKKVYLVRMFIEFPVNDVYLFFFASIRKTHITHTAGSSLCLHIASIRIYRKYRRKFIFFTSHFLTIPPPSLVHSSIFLRYLNHSILSYQAKMNEFLYFKKRNKRCAKKEKRHHAFRVTFDDFTMFYLRDI